MQTLVVAEKPSVARDIARVLGAKDKGENCLIGGGYAVTWALGHLVTLKEPQELDERYTRWRAEDLPILPEKMETKVIKKTKSQFLAVKKLMNDKETQDIICATDSGREGELIFRYIYEQAGCKKPVRRLWISSMTDEAIRAGFDSLRPSADYDALYASARCRADADWLIGMNATRAYTIRYNVLDLDNKDAGSVEYQNLQRTIKQEKEEVSSSLVNLYNDVLQKRNEIQTAKAAYELEKTKMETAERKWQLGTIGRLEYMQQQNSLKTKEIAVKTGDLALFQAMETYDWAVKGNLKLSQ